MCNRTRLRLCPLLVMLACVVGTTLFTLKGTAQQAAFDPLSKYPLSKTKDSNLLLTPTVTPETAFLFGLERKFAAAVAEGGGPAFASFFDKNGVTLGNRAAMQMGQSAVAAQANWSPKDYQLSWTPEGGEMGPSGDMGFTWGHYKGHVASDTSHASDTTGRYMTVWKKEADGTWKVVLDSSNEDAPNAPACTCKVDEKP